MAEKGHKCEEWRKDEEFHSFAERVVLAMYLKGTFEPIANKNTAEAEHV